MRDLGAIERLPGDQRALQIDHDRHLDPKRRGRYRIGNDDWGAQGSGRGCARRLRHSLGLRDWLVAGKYRDADTGGSAVHMLRRVRGDRVDELRSPSGRGAIRHYARPYQAVYKYAEYTHIRLY